MTEDSCACRSTDEMRQPLLAVAPASAVLAVASNHFHPWVALSPIERARCRSLHSQQDRVNFAASRALTRLLLARWAGLAPSTGIRFRWYQKCSSCRTPHGRPTLFGCRPPGVSWAYAGGMVAAAVGAGAIGVDIALTGFDDDDPRSMSPRRTAAGAAAKAGLGELADLLASRSLFSLPAGEFSDPATGVRGHVVCGGAPEAIDLFALVDTTADTPA